jgi:hypothetical protein
VAAVELAVDDEEDLLAHVVQVPLGNAKASQPAAYRLGVGRDDRAKLELGRTIGARPKAVGERHHHNCVLASWAIFMKS